MRIIASSRWRYSQPTAVPKWRLKDANVRGRQVKARCRPSKPQPAAWPIGLRAIFVRPFGTVSSGRGEPHRFSIDRTGFIRSSRIAVITQRSLVILGTRGIPGAHGGFETFAEQLSLFLVARGWRVAVYCQHDVDSIARRLWTDAWNGVERINIAVTTKGPLGTLDFDWRCTRDAMVRDSVCLVLGYNSAVFLPLLRLKRRRVLINMDGLEWRRQKWSRPVRGWFWVNEWIAAWSANRMVADHPAIADHLASRRSRSRIVMIPYGGVPIEAADPAPLAAFGLAADRYLISIARIEPENNILEIVQAFSLRPRNATLAVLGRMDDANAYHRAVKAAASPQVSFLGPIYDPDILRCLRFNARAYVHGHSAGGTNPSLVEALWAGNAVIAHDNVFNRWTAGPAQVYFKDVAGCDVAISAVFGDDGVVTRARVAARLRARHAFNWSDVLMAYERELLAVGDFQVDASDVVPAKRDAP